MSTKYKNKKLLKKNTKKKNQDLYTDNNPKDTIKNLGYKDEEKAKYTIDAIKNYSKKYQFQVINTMYNRAKFHKNRTENMKKAMKIFKKWLDNYKNINDDVNNNDNYDFLKLDIINKFEKLAEEYNVSLVTRGIKKSSVSDTGFLVVYREIGGKKNKNKLKKIPVKKEKPNGVDWYRKRDVQIKAKMAQIKKQNLKLFDENNLPTRIHLNLIMCAYSPSKKINNMK